MKKKGVFITFEGTDGVGKSTQVGKLAQWLRKKGHPVLLTREPGGEQVGEKIRQILLDPSLHLTDRAEILLYEAARAQHVAQRIRPALKRGAIVLCDRFLDATIAYQAFGRKLSVGHVDWLNRFAIDDLYPDLTILLDRPVKSAMASIRTRKKGAGGDRIEQAGISFQNRVRKGYRAVAKRDQRRIKTILVQENPSGTQEAIRRLVTRYIRA